jgi:hypothetical protein
LVSAVVTIAGAAAPLVTVGELSSVAVIACSSPQQ